MLTQEDIQNVSDAFAVKTDTTKTSRPLTSVDNRLNEMEIKLLKMDLIHMRIKHERYERWFHEIAAKVGVTLVP